MAALPTRLCRSWPVAPRQADEVCACGPAEDGILIAQYLWGAAHMDGMGWLVTQLSWDADEPVALEQRFCWGSSSAWDELSRWNAR